MATDDLTGPEQLQLAEALGDPSPLVDGFVVLDDLAQPLIHRVQHREGNRGRGGSSTRSMPNLAIPCWNWRPGPRDRLPRRRACRSRGQAHLDRHNPWDGPSRAAPGAGSRSFTMLRARSWTPNNLTFQ